MNKPFALFLFSFLILSNPVLAQQASPADMRLDVSTYVDADDVTSGVVSSSPSGINQCRQLCNYCTCSAEFEQGTSVRLTATSYGYTQFLGWVEGDYLVGGSEPAYGPDIRNQLLIAMDEDKAYTVVFTEPLGSVNEATNITRESADLSGSVNPQGLDISFYFDVGVLHDGAFVGIYNVGNFSTDLYLAKNSWTNISTDITGLECGKAYAYRVWTSGGMQSNISEFTTQACIPDDFPAITNVLVSEVSDSAALNFSAEMSGSLPEGFYVALNFDNQQGGWLDQDQPGGHLPMQPAIDNNFSVNYTLEKPGLRNFRAAIFDENGVIASDWTDPQTCLLESCIRAVSKPVVTGNPDFTGSGSLLMRGVDVASGNYHYANKGVDLPRLGPDFQVFRAYNSNTGAWTFNLDMKAGFVPNTYERQIIIGPREDGHYQQFFKDMDGEWYALNPGNFDQLVEMTDGRLRLYTQGDLVYEFASPASNEMGRLERVLDRQGNFSQIQYGHTDNRITSATDLSGYTQTIMRDSSGRIVQLVGHLNNTLATYSWYPNGMLEAYTNPRGIETRYNYVDTQLTGVIDPRGHQITSISYVNDQVSRVSDAYDQSWNFSYTSAPDQDGLQGTGIERWSTDQVNNNLVYIIDKDRTRVLGLVDKLNFAEYQREQSFQSFSSSKRIAEAALVTREENFKGGVTDKFYTDDGRGRPEQIIQRRLTLGLPDQVTDLSWENIAPQQNLQVLTTLTPPGVSQPVRYRNFTQSGKPQEVEDSEGAITQYEYDFYGSLIGITDARGFKQIIKTNNLGRPTRITDALGNETHISYDNYGRIWSVKDPRGYSRYYEYDANDNLTWLQDEEGQVTQYEYDASDNLIKLIDPTGHETHFTYDLMNRLVEKTYQVGSQTLSQRTEYDPFGRVHRLINEVGSVQQLDYNVRNKPVFQIQSIDAATEQVTEYRYDANGNMIRKVDAEGRSWQYTYDDLDRLLSVEDGEGHITTYTYNLMGLLASEIAADGKETQYSYDATGRLTRILGPDGVSTRADYDSVGNLVRVRRGDLSASETRYDYDALNRLIKWTDGMGREWHYEYDAVGNLLREVKPSQDWIAYQYDGLNRLISKMHSDGTEISFSYDARGNRLSMSDAQGDTYYEYDALNQLTQIRYPLGLKVAFEYDAAGQLSRLTYPGGKSVTYDYDLAGHITELTDWLGHSTRYQRDRTGLVTQILRDNGVTTQQQYDALGRLDYKATTGSQGDIISRHQLSLDAVGRVTQAAMQLPLLPTDFGPKLEMQVDNANRLVSVNAQSVEHDPDGRMTFDPLQQVNYSFNPAEQLTQVIKNGQTLDQFAYDGDGRRVLRTGDNENLGYIHDHSNALMYRLLAETDLNGNPLRYYLYGDGLVAQIEDNQHRYYHFDPTGNTLALTDASGTVTDRYAYESFGRTRQEGQTANPFRFVGQYGVMDDGNGLHWMRARYYRSDLRRFVSQDPLLGEIQDPMSLNRYQYVGGDPIMGIDPSGYIKIQLRPAEQRKAALKHLPEITKEWIDFWFCTSLECLFDDRPEPEYLDIFQQDTAPGVRG